MLLSVTDTFDTSRAKKRGLHALDAPVSGGDIGARDAKLSIMCGGEEEDFEEVSPILGQILFCREVLGRVKIQRCAIK